MMFKTFVDVRVAFATLLVACVGDNSIIDPGDAQSDALLGNDASDSGVMADAGGDSGGEGGVDGSDGAPPQPYRRVFITSTTHESNFGGLAAGDAICASAASAAKLGGNWAAWLSTTTTSAASRLEHATVPYQLLDGTEIAANWTALTFGTLSAPINMDEYEKAVPMVYFTSGFAWTGTSSDGTTNTSWTDSTCSDWAFVSAGGDSQHIGACGGDSTGTSPNWTAYSCYCATAVTLSLYCIEQHP